MKIKNNYDIVNYIINNDIKDIEFLNKLINASNEKIEKIRKEQWNTLYDNVKHFIGLDAVINDIKSNNYFDYNIYEKIEELKKYIYSTDMSIDRIIRMSSLIELNLINSNFSLMVCDNCKCKDCKFCNNDIHCNGYSCTECKQNNLNGYDWCCEE